MAIGRRTKRDLSKEKLHVEQRGQDEKYYVVDKAGRILGSWYGEIAFLFAAAPDLLEAAKAVLNHPHVKAYLPYDPNDTAFHSLTAASPKLRARIDKSTEGN